MEEIISKLQQFGFNKAEAQVYYTLVRNPLINGSQIAKILNIPRTSVYSALNVLYQKGIVFLLPGESNEYKAQSPDKLFEKLESEINNDLSYLKDCFSKISINNDKDQFWNIAGFDNICSKIKEILKSTEKELYINTNIDLMIFKSELQNLVEKSVRIILFSFEKQSHDLTGIEFYYNDKMEVEHSLFKRIMLVSDSKISLIASGSSNEEYTGTFSDNPLLSSIVSEHIHNDIYISKLEKKYKKDLIDKDIIINSLHEKSFSEKPRK